MFRDSPFFHMVENDIPFIRRNLVGEEALIDFPVLTELHNEGVTDYLAAHVPFGKASPNQESGFSEADVRALCRIKTWLAVACKVRITVEISRNLLIAYVGAKVLGGNISRCDTETVHAVIWYSDMRNSTRLAEKLELEAYLNVLNDMFEATTGPVIANGGEVLLLIGDAVFAIFPCLTMGPQAAAEAARKAAMEAMNAMDVLDVSPKEQAEDAISCGIALHVGDLTY